MNKLILIIVFLNLLEIVGCNEAQVQIERINSNSINNESIKKNEDTCLTIRLGDILFLDFKVGMTENQFNQNVEKLVKSNRLKNMDYRDEKAITLAIPYNSEGNYYTTDYDFAIIPNFEGCYLNSITLRLDGYDKGIVDLLEEKYGKGEKLEDQYLHLDDNNQIDNPKIHLYWMTERNKITINTIRRRSTSTEGIYDNITEITYESIELLRIEEVKKNKQEESERIKAEASKEIL